MNNRGFTLIELLITIAVIGILAAIAIPAYVGQQKSAARTEAHANLQNLRLLEEQFMAEKGLYSPCGGAATDPCSEPAVGTPVTLGTAGKDHPGNVDVIRSTGDPRSILPGFRPGAGSSLGFSYWVVNGQRITNPNAQPITGGVSNRTAADPPCFVAFAQGNTASRVNGETFAIDCNNNKNF